MHLFTTYFILIVFVFAALPCSAQLDTIFFEDFESVIEDVVFFPDVQNTLDSVWLNFDRDGIPDHNGDAELEWFALPDLRFGTDFPPEANRVVASSSFLVQSENSSQNYLATPPIKIPDEGPILFQWKSAPAQGPRFHDGYMVLVSPSGGYEPEDYTDTLFIQAQMLDPVDTCSFNPLTCALNVDSFSWMPTEGYIHANGFTDSLYFFLPNDSANTYRCILEPHELSLEKYSGTTIRIAFFHGSQNDNLISIDDVLVLGDVMVSNTGLTPPSDLTWFPNPVRSKGWLSFSNSNPGEGIIELRDALGHLMWQNNLASFPRTPNGIPIQFEDVPAGFYTLSVSISGQQQLIKVIAQGN